MNWVKVISQILQLILAILKNYNSEEKEIVIKAIKNNPRGVLDDKKHSVRDIAAKYGIDLPNDPAAKAYLAYVFTNAFYWEQLTEAPTNYFNTLVTGDVVSNTLILDYQIMFKDNNVTFYQDTIKVKMKARRALKATVIITAICEVLKQACILSAKIIEERK